MKKNEILLSTMEQMPDTFTSHQFNKQAIKNGFSPLRIKHKGLSAFISKYAIIEFKGAKTWHKKVNNKTNAMDETIVKYFEALKKLQTILSYTSQISMAEFSIKNKISKNLSIVLQKGGIIEKIKDGRYPQWRWISIKPTREMAIKTIQELTKLNTDAKKEKESKMNKDTVLEFNNIKPTGSKKEFIERLASLAINKQGKNKILNEIKEWQINGKISKKQAFDLRAAIGILDTAKIDLKEKQKQVLIDYYKIKLFFGLITILIKAYYK